MDLSNHPELMSIRDSVFTGMLAFMDEGDVSYARKHVELCARILDDHLIAVSAARTPESATECVRKTVIKLNELNDRVGGELIETDQRDQICELIISAGAILGFNGKDEDVTEEWREW